MGLTLTFAIAFWELCGSVSTPTSSAPSSATATARKALLLALEVLNVTTDLSVTTNLPIPTPLSPSALRKFNFSHRFQTLCSPLSLSQKWCELILGFSFFGVTLCLDCDFRNLRVKTLRKSPLDINLTKWLSRCECSFHKDKDQKTRYGENRCKTQMIKTKPKTI